ncbi:MAG TPA: right-handed parallel beta-helix repeat-containing protein, partial [Gemmatimonadales bacterium]|nr:right-handed parallel beta-helix repeat-containing protein [Gemmatimonadales bacterium]
MNGSLRRVALGLALGWVVPALIGAREAAAQQIPVRVGGVASSFGKVPFDLPLEVDLSARADKLGSFAARITWNPAVLAFVSGRDADFGRMTVNSDSAGGVIRLTGANPAGVGGKVVLGVARFVPVDSVSSDTIGLDVTELYAAGSFADLLPSAVWGNQAYCPAVGRYGDINANGTVNSADALLALTHAAGLSITQDAALGDVDGDGLTGARDALLMLAAGIDLDVGGFRVFLVAPGACAAPRRPLLDMTPGNLTMDVGQQVQYTAFASDSAGAGLAVTDIIWRSSDTLVARVTMEGVVTAVAPGLVTISVRRTSGTQASASVTVAQRHTHWVDALASPEEQNQLGAPELPFRTIPQALAYADPGDTVRVRSGRYDDSLLIDRPVVLMGDTAGGKPRPLISAYRYFYTGINIHTPGRVELHALRVDTLTVGVWATKVDTLLVRWVEFRSAAQSYQASLYVDTADVVRVERSDFFGPGNEYYYANNGIVVDSALVVSVDSSYLAEYGDDAISLYNVDSVSVRASVIRDNYGYGVYYCGQCYLGTVMVSKAVFSANRFVQNNYGHVYVDNARTVRFDHNRAVGGGYDGYTVYGDTGVTLVTLLGDSLATRDYGSWLYLYRFDSLAVDSAVIVVRDGYQSLDGGRSVSVRDTRFLEITGEALDIYPWPRDSTALRLARVEFRGPDSSACDRCGYGVYGYNLNVDADSVRMTNLWSGFYLSDSRAA